MTKRVTPLTDKEVQAARPREKEYNLSDGQGLLLRIKPSGSKNWLYNYTHAITKKRINLTLGQYPAFTLAQAREKASEYRRLRAQGIDPQEQKANDKRAAKAAYDNTLQKVAAQWFDVKLTKVTPAYGEDIWRSLELHVFPSLGTTPIHLINAPETIEILKPLAAKGSLETVKRVGQRLNEVMNYAVNTGLVSANPLSGIRAAFETPAKKNMPALKPSELPELMLVIANASIKLTTRALLEWQLHTMSRPSEAAGTRWNEIDLEKAVWTIPAERMKKKRPHAIPLSPQALALLNMQRPISGHREHVFPADRNPRNSINEQTANMALKRMGFGGRLVAHGMRSIASTTLNEQGFDPDVIEAALAHVDSNEVRAAYNRAEYLERRRVMMNWWSEHISKAATGDTSISATASVRSLHAAS